MRKIISQILLILLVMFIGVTSVFITQAYAASKASINCSGSVTEGSSFNVSLNLPANVIGAESQITAKFSNGTTQSKKIVYVKGMESSFPNQVSFTASAIGNATITASSIVLTDDAANEIESGGSTSININVVSKQPENPTPTPTPTPAPDPASEQTNNNQETSFSNVNETVYTTEKVNIRKSYSATSEKVATVAKGTSLKRTGISQSGWSKVEYNGAVCYVSSQYLTTTNPNDSTQPANDTNFSEVNETVYATQKVNVRKSNSTSSQKVATVAAGTSFKRIGISQSGWSKVEYNGEICYVSSQYLTTTKEESGDPEFVEKEDKVIPKNDCNVRKSWSTSSEKIGKLAKGEEVTRTASSENGWSRIDYKGTVGYVLTELLEVQEIEENQGENQVTEEDKLNEIKQEIGVLPEVGNNVANIIYVFVSCFAISVTLGLYFMLKKN